MIGRVMRRNGISENLQASVQAAMEPPRLLCEFSTKNSPIEGLPECYLKDTNQTSCPIGLQNHEFSTKKKDIFGPRSCTTDIDRPTNPSGTLACTRRDNRLQPFLATHPTSGPSFVRSSLSLQRFLSHLSFQIGV